MKYICNACSKPCTLEFEHSDYYPFRCPFNPTYHEAKWKEVCEEPTEGENYLKVKTNDSKKH